MFPRNFIFLIPLLAFTTTMAAPLLTYDGENAHDDNSTTITTSDILNATVESDNVHPKTVPDLDAALNDNNMANNTNGTLATTEVVETKAAAASGLVDPVPRCCSCECNYWIGPIGWVCLVMVVAQLVGIILYNAIRYYKYDYVRY